MINYTTNLETFIFKRAWAAIFEDLTDEQAGKLMKAIYCFLSGNDKLPEDPLIKPVYKIITHQLNESAHSYYAKIGLLHEKSKDFTAGRTATEKRKPQTESTPAGSAENE